MDRPWLSALIAASTAKADSLQQAIDSLAQISEILTTHNNTQQVKQTMHLLSVERDYCYEAAARARQRQTEIVGLGR